MEPRPLSTGVLRMFPHSSIPGITLAAGVLPRQGIVRPEAGVSALGHQASAEPQQNTEVCFLSNSRKQAWLPAHLQLLLSFWFLLHVMFSLISSRPKKKKKALLHVCCYSLWVVLSLRVHLALHACLCHIVQLPLYPCLLP